MGSNKKVIMGQFKDKRNHLEIIEIQNTNFWLTLGHMIFAGYAGFIEEICFDCFMDQARNTCTNKIL